MLRAAFITSFALHAALLAACVLTMPQRTDSGTAVLLANWQIPGDLVAAIPSEANVPDDRPERIAAPRISAVPEGIPVHLAPALLALPAGNFTTADTGRFSSVAFFAPEYPSVTKAGAGSRAVGKSPAKGRGASNGEATRAAQTYTPARYGSCPPPVFPNEARKARLSGTALLAVVTDAEGRPLSVTLRRTSGHAILDTAAVRAVRQWRFVPAQCDGKPVNARLEIPVRFALSE